MRVNTKKILVITATILATACGREDWENARKILETASPSDKTEETSSIEKSSKKSMNPPGCQAIESAPFDDGRGIESYVLAKCGDNQKLFHEFEDVFTQVGDCNNVTSFDLYLGDLHSKTLVCGEGKKQHVASNGEVEMLGSGSLVRVVGLEIPVLGEIEDIRHVGQDFEILSFHEFHEWQLTTISAEGWILSAEKVGDRHEHLAFAPEGILKYSYHSYGINRFGSLSEAPVGTKLLAVAETAFAYETSDGIVVLQQGDKTMHLARGPVHLLDSAQGLVVSQGSVQVILEN